MARQRPVLLAPLRAAATRHQGAAPAELDLWAEAVLRLANVNVGAVALTTLLRATAATAPGPGVLGRLVEAATAAAEIGRRAGSVAVRASLDAWHGLACRPVPIGAESERAWWRGLTRCARDAPECVTALVAAAGAILERCGARFEEFVAAALKAETAVPARRAFLALESPEARRLLDRLAGQATFDALQPRLQAFVTALWGVPRKLRALPPAEGDARSRRTAVSSGVILVPEAAPGLRGADALDLYRASVAHASAHLALGAAPFEPGSLKPIQIVLVGLIEDARIEALAMRRLPGLRALWAPFHTAAPSSLTTAPDLLARLARALFDPDYADGDGFIGKARRLFRAEPDLHDPALSRRIGGLLGNDFGQMRLGFNAKQVVIDPPYRDDNRGLWRQPPPPPSDPPPAEIEIDVDAVRIERRPDDAGAPQAEHEPDPGTGAPRARPTPPGDDGVAVARYPEWDRAAQCERPDWVTVREIAPRAAPVPPGAGLLSRNWALQRRIGRLVRSARAGRPTRLRRQAEGVDLDLDAAIAAVVALRGGEIPDDRIHLRKASRTRDLAVLLLVDTSESTRDRVPATGASVIATEKLAVSALAEAMHALGDRFALRGFASNGRGEVRVARIKDFERGFDDAARARLAGLEPGYSTRLGGALRHAGAELGAVAATRRLVIALTDGAPSDVDVSDAAELVEDARRAALGLYRRGIDVFGITLDPSGQGAGQAVFGRRGHLPVRRIEELPERMSELYFRLSRR